MLRLFCFVNYGTRNPGENEAGRSVLRCVAGMTRHERDPLGCRCQHGGFDPAIFARAAALFDRKAFLAGLGAAITAAAWPSGARAESGVTVLRAARLFDGTAMYTPGVLVLQGSKIVSMHAGDAGSDATTIDLGDATIVPGFIDAHTHVANNVVTSAYLVRDRSYDSLAEAAISSLRNAQAILANGFTTVRDVGSGEGIDIAMRDSIAKQVVVGPRMLVAGPALSITGGRVDANDLPPFVHVDHAIESGISSGPYGFRERVREHVKRRVDLIKIVATGGVLSYGDKFDVPQFNLDEVQAVVDEATKFGLHVAGHAHGDRGIAVAGHRGQRDDASRDARAGHGARADDLGARFNSGIRQSQPYPTERRMQPT